MMMVSSSHIILGHVVVLCVNVVTVPEPEFEMSMYTVPENDRTAQLCIITGVQLLDAVMYTITAEQKSPPEADSKSF